MCASVALSLTDIRFHYLSSPELPEKETMTAIYRRKVTIFTDQTVSIFCYHWVLDFTPHF